MATAPSVAPLRPCPACARHARVTESACPFCGARFDASFRSVPRPQRPSGRLARAALMSLGASSVALAPACGSLPEDRVEPSDGGGVTEPRDGDIDEELIEVDGNPLSGELDTGLVATFYGSAIGMGLDIACTTAQDCAANAAAFSSDNLVYCCVREQCLLGDAAVGVACTDPLVQLIQASNYDQSCNVDSDCTAVAEGNFCVPGAMNCTNAAINVSAKAKYQADVANTNAAFCAAPAGCPSGLACGGSAGPWCVHGTCTVSECPGVVEGSGGEEAGVQEAGSLDAGVQEAGDE